MKPRKNMRVRVNARIASKVREKDLMEKARALMEDPELILPDCANECGACPFRKTRARLEKIARVKDDPAKLAKLATKGDRLARAYAGTIGLVHEEKAPYLASAKYPGGTVMFALRGRTDKEKLIGVQNFDSPKWRVMSVLSLVKKKGLHFYSFEDQFVCTGRESRPPIEYMEHSAGEAGAKRRDGNTFSCPHGSDNTERLEFGWTNSDAKAVLCVSCAVKNKNSLKKLAEGMAVPGILNEFNISVHRPLTIVSGDGKYRDVFDAPIDEDLLTRYASGEIGDRELVDSHIANVRRDLMRRDHKLFIRGDKSYGDDLEEFVKSITDDENEAQALEGMLSKVGHPVVVETMDSVNDILSSYWADHGMDALKAVVPSSIAKKHFQDGGSDEKSPMKILRKAMREAEHDRVSSGIPKYASLSASAKFVDEVVRAYKTRGDSGAVRIVEADTSSDHKMRSIAHAFYTALDITTKSWKYTQEEIEFGKHLSRFAKKLLESEGADEHHEAFATFLRESGSTEELTRV